MINLNDASLIKRLDASRMRDLLGGFPSQCAQAYSLAEKFNLPAGYKRIKNILFTGLGGSAIGADLVKSYLFFESKMPIAVNREYNLPRFVNKDTLVFACSYSGNTEETLSAYKEARLKNAKIICISSGGKLKGFAHQHGVPFITIPSGMPPRTALGFLSIIPLKVLANLGKSRDFGASVRECKDLLDDLRDSKLGIDIKSPKNIAKQLAKDFYNHLVFIYAASIHFDVAAMRMRGQLAENSKALASSHIFPEMNHNEIVGWVNPKKLFKDFRVVILRDKDNHPRTKLRMDITKSILEKDAGVKVIQIFSRGKSLLARILSLIYIGDFTSFYLAILNGIDPTPVERVTYLKGELAKR